MSVVPATPILEVRDAVKSFDGLLAVEGASFDVARGSITALIGPNGAGKTTMFDLLSGFGRPDAGSIRFAGRSIGGMAPHRIVRLGLVRTFQLTRVLAGMSVLDNMLIAARSQPGEHLASLLLGPGRVRTAEAAARRLAEELLETFGLREKVGDYAGTLSGGQRKLLEIARALMTDPLLVLLDEPMAGVNRTLGRSILDRIEALRGERGTTFLFVEHDMDVVMSRADRVVVMAQGRVIALGTPAEIRSDPAVVAAYLGTPLAEGRGMSGPVLATTTLVAGYAPQVDILNGVSIAVSQNEIVTVVGPNGAGKSTLLKALIGLVQPKSGSIMLAGQSIAGLRPSAIVRRGLGYVPQRENVFGALLVEENLEIGLTPRRDLPLRSRLDIMYALFPRLRERRRQVAGSLSGGERQMLAMARALMAEPKILLLDEPTAGLAPRFVDLMFEQVAAINRADVTILMVEQNAARALAMSHRGYVLDLGRNAYEGVGPALARDPKVADLYLGGLHG